MSGGRWGVGTRGAGAKACTACAAGVQGFDLGGATGGEVVGMVGPGVEGGKVGVV